MKRTTVLSKKPCKSINMLSKAPLICLITGFGCLKKLNDGSAAITMI